jgi:hypothetical protein
MTQIVCKASSNSPTWGVVDLFIWKVLPTRVGGGKAHIQKFKDAWVRHNRVRIIAAASQNKIPTELLAGVCWIEVGGDPDFIDRVAFEIRSLDWSGPDTLDRNLTITKSPAKTSFGSVSIQLRTAAQTLGIDPSELSTTQLRQLGSCLEKDIFNIDTVALHLKQLAVHEKFTTPLSIKQIRVIGARYNRGMGLSLQEIMKNTSYGDFIVKFWLRFRSLIQ